ncbi:DUF1330 domain-containing protein [Myxococcus sp. K15C18031901]|uniref:DUF1330 domain-containing protein n=1 Tax=Myxococcus dinghuensis TaxID=2906761 RepID=UPI0020A7EC23|nr:DUF1330 domain-containing protein [Myxococcus dinghuensis]MCP3101837.1 DUF1330 domain-containing protein [Myxococcus dinghuensis]
MPAYVVFEVAVHDVQTYARYKQLAPPSVARYGGRYLVRGGATEALEGTWQPPRFVIIEFPSTEQARAWWSSPEYAAAKALRHVSAHTMMLLMDGLPAETPLSLASAGASPASEPA